MKGIYAYTKLEMGIYHGSIRSLFAFLYEKTEAIVPFFNLLTFGQQPRKLGFARKSNQEGKALGKD